MIRLILPLLLAALLFPQKNEKEVVSDIERHRNELDRIRRELQDGRSDIRRLEGEEADLITKLRTVEKNLTLTNRYMKKLSEMEEVLRVEADSISADLKQTVRALEKRKTFLRDRIRQIYIRGRYHDLDVLFGSASFSSFLRRNIFYRVITDNDQRLIKNIFAEQRRIEEKKTDLEIRLADVHHISAEKRKEQKHFEEQKQSRRQILKKVKGDKKTAVKLVSELEKRQQEINRIVAALESARKARTGAAKKTAEAETDTFSELKGRLPWPVQGRVVKKFGTIVHPDYGSKTVNNGVDISARNGEKVICVAKGEVAYVGNLSGFGQFLICSHTNGYYSLYANLVSIDVKKGREVRPGDALGSAGETGLTDTPQIHFELRKERKILDPSDWFSGAD